MKNRSLAFFFLLLLIGGVSVACNQVSLTKPIHSAKLKLKVDSGPDLRLVGTGTAERLENGNWKLTLAFAGLSPESVEEVRLLNELEEPHPLPLQDTDGKLTVALEVPRERWLDSAPFVLSMHLHGQDNEALIAVDHRATESKLTPLGYVAATAWVVLFYVLPYYL